MTLLKQSHLKTSDESEGAASREQEGSGELVFDQKRGVMTKAEIKLVNTFNQDNVSIKVPVLVHYRLLDDEELAKQEDDHKAQREKMAEQRAKADEEAASPFSDAEARQLIAALKGKQSRRKAAETLSKKKVPDEHQEKIAKALDPLLADPDDGVRDMATQALKIWATEDNVPSLAKLVMDENNVFARARAMETLGRLKDKRGAEAVAASLLRRAATRKSSSRWERWPSPTCCRCWTVLTKAWPRRMPFAGHDRHLGQPGQARKAGPEATRFRRASGAGSAGQDRSAVGRRDTSSHQNIEVDFPRRRRKTGFEGGTAMAFPRQDVLCRWHRLALVVIATMALYCAAVAFAQEADDKEKSLPGTNDLRRADPVDDSAQTPPTPVGHVIVQPTRGRRWGRSCDKACR